MGPQDVASVLADLGADFGAVRAVEQGWSYWTFEVEPGWIFRFPRNDDIARSLEVELEVLPGIEAHVPFAVPHFEHVGSFRGRPYIGYRKIPGRPLRPEDLLDPGSGTDAVARALSSLHRVPKAAVAAARGINASVEGWRQRYLGLREEARARVFPRLDGPLVAAAERGFDRFLQEELPALEAVTVVHYDLGCAHILMDEPGAEVRGIIDFEEVTVGDPAVDFVGLLCTCGEEAVVRVLERYGGPDDDRLQARIRFYAWMGSYHALEYGLEQGDEGIVKDACDGLRIRLGHAALLA
ncbi:MAG: phosphotransferase [Myxococcales bacterium]|nr:phosphotransferase [Myxococcales bacterium]